MPVPFLGRLNPTEYFALVGSFLLVGFEAVIRVLTLALPTTLITLFYQLSSRIFNRLSTPAQKRAEERKKSTSTSIRDASDFVDLCALFGYSAEEHVLQTKDGYLLALHRLAWRKGEEDVKVNSGPSSVKKRVVYLHHGLLMNSEVWVCLTEAERSLPFVLVDRGFDVWLGNNRGNKYSKKCVKCGPGTLDFWNFSMDEFAFHDIPDSIAYVLESTGQPSLSYVGFSQGTAQAFASLAIHPKLNDQINVFIALAPAMSPAGLHNGVVDALVKASPQVLFLLFGRRSILSSATMWQSILYPPLFVKVIDVGLGFLFNWRTKNISTSQKLAAYPHLYSFTSTKSVVHWFQIIRNKSFQMYDDDVHPPLGLRSSSKYTKVAKYPTRNIKTPTVLVYGGVDSLVDVGVMLKELPPTTVATEIPHYEHLDFLWARDVDTQVFPHVFDALESFTDAGHTKEEYERYRNARHTSLNASVRFRHASHASDTNDSDIAEAMANVTNEIRSGPGGRNGLRNRSHQAREGLLLGDARASRGGLHHQQPLGTTDEETSDYSEAAPLSLQSTNQPHQPQHVPAPGKPPSVTETPSKIPTAAKQNRSNSLSGRLVDNTPVDGAKDDEQGPSTPTQPHPHHPHHHHHPPSPSSSMFSSAAAAAAAKLKGIGVRRGSGGGGGGHGLGHPAATANLSLDAGKGISVAAPRVAGGVVTSDPASPVRPVSTSPARARDGGDGAGGDSTEVQGPVDAAAASGAGTQAAGKGTATAKRKGNRKGGAN